MFDSRCPRIIHAEEYEILGEGHAIQLLLVEQADGSFRKANGDDLIAIHERFPGFVRSTWSVPDRL